MSRIGRKPVPVPDKVKVAQRGRVLIVEGPLGKLEAVLPEGVDVTSEGGTMVVVAPSPNRMNRGYQGLVRALLANMVHGVVHGYERNLEISGVGYKAEVKGNSVIFALGYTHTICLDVPPSIKVLVDKNQTKVTVKGIDKGLVGQIAAKIRSYKVPEPYQGKGVKYAEETIRRKAGKTGSK